jgi:23S rRNA G2445 N2-methylase RlmL
MEAELLRVVKRSPFHVRVPAPRRDGEAMLVYPFGAEMAWVAACYHRTSSRVLWDLVSSPAVRLEPLVADLAPLLVEDERLGLPPRLAFSVEVGPAADFEASPLQLRGAVKSALEDASRRRGVRAEVDAEAPDVVLETRRTGPPEDRRTLVSLDLGGGPRHRRGFRVAVGEAPLRETLAAQLVILSRWDARTEPLVDPMAGSGTIAIEAALLARAVAVRQPRELPLSRLPAFDGLPAEAPPLFSDARPRILAADVDAARVPTMIGNFRAAGLTGAAHEAQLVVAEQDARELTPEVVARLLGVSPRDTPGVFAFNPPYGHRIRVPGGEEGLLRLYADVGRALAAFRGWRAAVFVAHPAFVEAFGHRPTMTKPASNAELRGAFHAFRL